MCLFKSLRKWKLAYWLPTCTITCLHFLLKTMIGASIWITNHHKFLYNKMKHKHSFTWVGLESVHPYSGKGKTCPEPGVLSDVDSLMHHHSPVPCQSCTLQSQSANEWKITLYHYIWSTVVSPKQTNTTLYDRRPFHKHAQSLEVFKHFYTKQSTSLNNKLIY